MNAKPISVSLSSEMRALLSVRVKEERMTVSEYLRKCIREEAERARAKKVLLLNPSLVS